jgi:hypothetical protein
MAVTMSARDGTKNARAFAFQFRSVRSSLMWLMSDSGAVLFVAIVALMVALAVC